MTIIANGKIIAGKLVLNDAPAFQALVKQMPEGATASLALSEGESYPQSLMDYYEYVVKPYLLLVFISHLKVPSEVSSAVDVDAFMRIKFAEAHTKYLPCTDGYTAITVNEPISEENIESLLLKLNAWLKALPEPLSLPKRNKDTYQY